MAACTRCGAALEPAAAACPGCGTPAPDARSTAPLGSEGEAPAGSGTLVLGSGVPIDGPLPERRKPRTRPTPKPIVPAHDPRPDQDARPRDPRRERLKVPRLARRAPPAAQDPEPTPPKAPKKRAPWPWVIPPLVSVAALFVVLYFGRRGSELGAVVRFDATGRPELHVRCATCADGTTLALGDETASVDEGIGVLHLAPPLALGHHESAIAIRAAGRAERIARLEYDVEFVVSADQRGLGQPEPKLSVVFDAKPDVTFIVDGRVVAEGPSGIRRYELLVRAELTGPAKAGAKLEKRIPYVVKLASGESVRGELALSADIVPLLVDAPGESIVIEGQSFVLAGSTERDGMITVEGRAITVDPAGRFAQLMSVSAIGDTTVSVRASAPGRAPRFYPIRVKRVASLAAEAAEFERRAQSSYAAIADDVEAKRGWAVALEGKLTEVRSDGYTSSALLEVTKGCRVAPCLARLKVGERTSLTPGSSVAAYGYLAGMSQDAAGGRGLPEVRVEFLRGKP